VNGPRACSPREWESLGHPTSAALSTIKVRSPAITTEGEEMKLAGLLEPLQSPRHGEIGLGRATPPSFALNGIILAL
jgi:hypothetical protein